MIRVNQNPDGTLKDDKPRWNWWTLFAVDYGLVIGVMCTPFLWTLYRKRYPKTKLIDPIKSKQRRLIYWAGGFITYISFASVLIFPLIGDSLARRESRWAKAREKKREREREREEKE